MNMPSKREKLNRSKEYKLTYHCPICDESFNKHWRFKLHLQHHSSPTVTAYFCPLCKAGFAFASMFRNHLLLVHTIPKMERPYQCNVKNIKCRMGFSRASCLNAHKIVQHEIISPFICKKCGKICVSKCHWRKHLKGHCLKKSKQLECDKCGREFYSISYYKWHKVFHAFPKSFGCEYCHQRFSSEDLKQIHVFTYHKEGKTNTCRKRTKGRYPCQRYDKICTQKAHMEEHMETHNEKRERNFVCEVCGQRFYQKRYLVHHKAVIHDGKQSKKYGRFVCAVCHKVCSQKHHLKQHMEMHCEKRERNFVCEVCGKGFFSKKNLASHKRVHENSAFPCPHCAKVLGTKNGLDGHLRLHTGEKCYACAVCSKGFPSSSGLRYHQRNSKCKGSDNSETTSDHVITGII